jgi:hypothetical protein
LRRDRLARSSRRSRNGHSVALQRDELVWASFLWVAIFRRGFYELSRKSPEPRSQKARTSDEHWPFLETIFEARLLSSRLPLRRKLASNAALLGYEPSFFEHCSDTPSHRKRRDHETDATSGFPT